MMEWARQATLKLHRKSV